MPAVGRGDHPCELQREPKHVLPLRFSSERPLMNGTRLCDAANQGHGRCAENGDEFAHDLTNGQRHCPFMGTDVRQGITRLLFFHRTKYTTLNPTIKPTQESKLLCL